MISEFLVLVHPENLVRQNLVRPENKSGTGSQEFSCAQVFRDPRYIIANITIALI